MNFALFTLIFNVLVILWGAFVRASGSGAGCGAHWPLCNGEIIPNTDKIQTLIELSHRLTSGIAFLLVVILFFSTRKSFPANSIQRKFASYSLIFMILEALIGAALVLLKLVGDNDSSHRAFVVGFHLINSFALLGSLTLTWRVSTPPYPWIWPWPKKLVSLIFLFALVSCFGAITALGDTLFPATSLKEGIAQDFLSTSHFLIKLRVWHPALAIITSILIWIYCSVELNKSYTKTLYILRALIIAQIIFGFLNLLLLAPIWSQLIHLLLACCCWICLMLATAKS